jgi:co-chaperonin GroES (HSP10)
LQDSLHKCMDKNNQDVFDRISGNMPEHLRENLTKEVVDTTEEDMAREALKMDISPRARRELKNRIEDGSFRTSETVENEEVIAEIDAYNERSVREAIARGDLPDPKDDPFIAQRNRRLAEKDGSPTQYALKVEMLKAAADIKPLRDLVLVHPEPEEHNSHGIFVVSNKKATNETAQILKTGPDVKTVKAGDRILINRYSFDTFTTDKVTFRIGKESDIIAIHD